MYARETVASIGCGEDGFEVCLPFDELPEELQTVSLAEGESIAGLYLFEGNDLQGVDTVAGTGDGLVQRVLSGDFPPFTKDVYGVSGADAPDERPLF